MTGRSLYDAFMIALGLVALAAGWSYLWHRARVRVPIPVSFLALTVLAALFGADGWRHYQPWFPAKWAAYGAVATLLATWFKTLYKPVAPPPVPEPPPPPDSPIWAPEPWADLNRRRRAHFWVLAGPLLAAALLAVAEGRLLHIPAVPGGTVGRYPWLLWVLIACGLLWAAAGVVTWRRAAFWPCPRCGKPFLLSGAYLFLWLRRCAHCRLPEPGFQHRERREIR